MNDELKRQRSQRKYVSAAGTVQDHPTGFGVDYDRILYSSSYRRLSSVSQVTLASEGQLTHHRQLHSHKVSRLASELAHLVETRAKRDNQLELIEHFGGLDRESAEAGALAHDIGHPPFGHIGEGALSRMVTANLAKEGAQDGYEGNAQAFRIVTRLARLCQDRYPGLNLTYATLNAMQKYPWTRKDQLEAMAATDEPGSEKYGSYEVDLDPLVEARAYLQIGRRRSLEAQIVDIADDITYAVHDLEDFYRAGRIDMSALRNMSATDAQHQTIVARCVQEWKKLQAIDKWMLGSPRIEVASEADPAPGTFESAWGRTIARFPDMRGRYEGLGKQRGALRDYTRNTIVYLATQLCLSEEFGVVLTEEGRADVILLKQLTRLFVIEDPRLGNQHAGQAKIVEALFDYYLTELHAGRFGIVTGPFREEAAAARSSGTQALVRTVSDLVAGLTEETAIDLYHKISGISLGSYFLNRPT